MLSARKHNRSLKVGLTILIVISTTVVSCQIQATPTAIQSNKETLDEVIPASYPTIKEVNWDRIDREEGGYYLVHLADESIPAPVSTSFTESSDGTNIVSGNGLTNPDGLISFEDSQLGAIIPIVVMDGNNHPIEDINVKYLLEDNLITILVTDPKNVFAPRIVVVDPADLWGQSESFDSHPSIDYFKVRPAKAAFPILVVIGIVLGFYTLIEVVMTGQELDETMQENLANIIQASDGFDYACFTPELIKQRSNFFGELILAMIPIPGSEKAQVVFDVGGIVGGQAVVDKLNDEYDKPLLFIRYSMPAGVEEAQLEWADQLSENNLQRFGVWEQVGDCAYVPDLIGKTLIEAINEVEGLGILYTTVDEGGLEIVANQDGLQNYITIDQEPKTTTIAATDYGDNEVRSMLPVGEYDGFESLQITTKLFIDEYGCNNPDLTPEEIKNCGPHIYKHVSSEIILKGNYLYCDPNPLREPREFRFHFHSCDNGRICFQMEDFVRIEENVFQKESETKLSESVWDVNRWTYTLNSQGYTYVHSYFGQAAGGSTWSCDVIDTFIISE